MLLCDPFPDYGEEQVSDVFTRAGVKLTWELATPLNVASAQILGHIVPSRTHALGQSATMGGTSVIDGEINLSEGVHSYGNSNQGHSAQFYVSFAERKEYWISLLEAFGLEIREGLK